MIENWQDFIYFHDDALSEDQCDSILSVYRDNFEGLDGFREHNINENGILAQKQTVRDDYAYFMSPFFNSRDHINWVNDAVHNGLNDYLNIHPFLWPTRNVSWRCLKYHVVKQAGGYHEFHHEWYIDDSRDRVLVWHISLTSHKNEGELEFLHYGHRIEPKAGRLIIWPSGFTHTHRGNAIRTDTEKHYITGWYFCT